MSPVVPRLTLSLVCLTVSLSGCIATNAAMLHPSKTYAPVSSDLVHVFVAESDVPGSFEKIAVINAGGSSSFTNEAQMIRAMQRKAGSLGANGVLLSDILEASAGAKVAGAIFGVDTQRKGKVVAIRFQPPTETDAVASSPAAERVAQRDQRTGMQEQLPTSPQTHTPSVIAAPPASSASAVTSGPPVVSPPSAPAPTAVSRPRAGEGVWVSIPGARSYYWHECDVAKKLPQDKLIRFGTEEEAQAAGYQPPTFFPQCKGPAGNQ